MAEVTVQLWTRRHDKSDLINSLCIIIVEYSSIQRVVIWPRRSSPRVFSA
jgi:hypothetical protein